MDKQAEEGEARYTMRLPSSLYEDLRKLAKAERRSINQQIIQIVANAVEAKKNA